MATPDSKVTDQMELQIRVLRTTTEEANMDKPREQTNETQPMIALVLSPENDVTDREASTTSTEQRIVKLTKNAIDRLISQIEQEFGVEIQLDSDPDEWNKIADAEYAINDVMVRVLHREIANGLR